MRLGVISLCLVVAVAGCADGDGSETTQPRHLPTTTSGATADPSSTTTAVVTTPSTTSTTVVDDPYAERRLHMVDDQIEARLIYDERVLQAMRAVPRHEFVPEEYLDQSYNDHPLPIGHGQTISQPYIVALMSQELGVQPGDRVLEIGTGSGYQAAVLAAMGVEVYTIEIIEELATAAADRLERLGYNAEVLWADGYFGWEEHAPFDAIIVTAAPDHLPQPLVGQLASGGRLVVPIGPIGAVQTLWRFRLRTDGDLDAENLGGVVFVPFTRAEE